MQRKYALFPMMAAAVFLVGAVADTVLAGIVISSTRVVYPAQASEVTVRLHHNGDAPALVQAWLDKGDAGASPSTIEVPFVVSPVRLRLNPGLGQTLRISYTKEPLPTDKETLFWLNVLEVPPKAKDRNTLEFAFRTRIKLFFRPEGLAGNADEAPAKVRWEVVRDPNGKGYALKGSNPTPYYVNLGAVSLVTAGSTFDAGQGYIAPGESQRFPIRELGAKDAMPGAQVAFTAINDSGLGVQATAPASLAAAP